MRAVATAVVPLASQLEAMPALRAQLGSTAFAQLVALAVDPETAAPLVNQIWVRSVFPQAVNGLLRLLPDHPRELQGILRALARVPQPPRVDNAELIAQRFDTREEAAGLV